MSSLEERLRKAMEAQRAASSGIIQSTILEEIADLLEELLEEVKKSTAHGKLVPLLVNVGPTVTQLDQRSTVTMPWKSVVFANDGPAPVFIAINKDYFDSEVPLKPNEQFPVDMGRDMIQRIMLTTTNPITGAPGGNASVRLFAVK